MRCIDIPQKTQAIVLERTGVRYTLHELPARHRLQCNISKETYDTPQNAILAASDISKEDIEGFSEDELLMVYMQVLELSYPNILKELSSEKATREIPKNSDKLYTQAVISLMRNGHSNVFEYPVSFFNECVEELNIHDVETIKRTAIAVRGAKVEDFKGFLDSFERKDDTDLHKKNIDLLKKDKK